MPGGLTRFLVSGGSVLVTARSSIHDTKTVWSELEGTLSVDPVDPAAAPEADLRVDMRVFDAGDRLKNWKLKSDLDPDRWPTATFRLVRLEGVRDAGGGRIVATAVGTLAWHGRETEVSASGSGRIDSSGVTAEAAFDLDVTTLGVKPPRILMFKVESVVRVEVKLTAGPA